MDIRILPSNIANMIAAGEVVQRPASVVKELMENAVDAGADNVSVIIQDSGRTLIQVIDNGCGMSPDQAVLAFERHATSKLSCADDLNNILTLHLPILPLRGQRRRFLQIPTLRRRSVFSLLLPNR